MRTSENPLEAKFAELPFHALRWIEGKRKGRGCYAPAPLMRLVASPLLVLLWRELLAAADHIQAGVDRDVVGARPAAYGVLSTVVGIDDVVAGAAADLGDLVIAVGCIVRKEGVRSRSTVQRIGAGPIVEIPVVVRSSRV